MRWRESKSAAYLALSLLILLSAIASLGIGWTAFGRQIDQYAYDFLFRLEPASPWQPSSVILAIDEETLSRYGGLTGMREALADGLNAIQPAAPAAVAVDLILAEPGNADEHLDAAFAGTKNLVLSCDMRPDGSAWEEPLARFRAHAAAVAEVHADLDKYDAVSRDIPLEKAVATERRWALALEAFRVTRNASIVETPNDLSIGDLRIPSRMDEGRTMRIRYAPLGMIPQVSIAALKRDPSLADRFRGKVVFAGVTAQSAVRDRWMTPFSNGVIMPGIEMNANAYETIAHRAFLIDASLTAVVASCFLFAAAAGLSYAFAAGWVANLLTLAILAAVQLLPAVAFAHSTVWPWLPATLAVFFATGAGAAWRHLLVGRQLARAEHDKDRYQRTIRFVTHEMRTPLTAIQGSSELISRYSQMPEAKRREMADLINAESKRLAGMITAFLSAERLSEGEMAIRREPVSLSELVDRCVTRARALASGKNIAIDVSALPDSAVSGDRELLEYALYNLLTNAVKYSPANTRISVAAEASGNQIRLSVTDQGIGMEKHEVHHVFERFYRTKRAEQSGEVGTGIGLSIVEEIIRGHGGSVEVSSEPGRGSCFTLVLQTSRL